MQVRHVIQVPFSILGRARTRGPAPAYTISDAQDHAILQSQALQPILDGGAHMGPEEQDVSMIFVAQSTFLCSRYSPGGVVGVFYVDSPTNMLLFDKHRSG